MALTQVPSTMIDRSLATIASASTTDLSTTQSENVSVTGTTTITALGTVQVGAMRIVTFTGALTLTHNATSLILPGAANITTAAGDVATFISLGSGNWRCVNYTKASGQAVIAPASAFAGMGGQVFTSNGTFTIPAGVNNLKVTVVGGGGGQGAPFCCVDHYGGTGGTSSVSSGTQTISTISATGGAGASGSKGGTGGTGSGGDLNADGGSTKTGATIFSNGIQGSGGKYGVGGFNYNYGLWAGGGGAAIKYLTGVTPGNTLTVTIGAAGSTGAAGGATLYAAASGVVVIEW